MNSGSPLIAHGPLVMVCLALVQPQSFFGGVVTFPEKTMSSCIGKKYFEVECMLYYFKLTADACGDCDGCSARCVNGLDIAARMERARQVLA